MIHQVLAVAVLSAAVASAAYAGEQCYEGIAYVGFRDGVQVAYGCGTPPEGGNVQNTICPEPYLEFDIPVIGENALPFCSTAKPVTTGCPLGFFQFRGTSVDPTTWTCVRSSCISSNGDPAPCGPACEAAGGVYNPDDGYCNDIPLCNVSADCDQDQRDTCSMSTGRCGQGCGFATYCYGAQRYCSNAESPSGGVCSDCTGIISFDDSVGFYVCSTASADPISTSAAQARRRRAAALLNAQMLLNNPDCPPEEGVLACPIRGGRGAVECINTLYELESCGGCSYGGEGVDCTKLPNVADGGVACMDGTCDIVMCNEGFAVQNATCVAV